MTSNGVSSVSPAKTRVILVGVGLTCNLSDIWLFDVVGATCSGKTTLAKHLKSILPDSVIIHQDPQELVPYHPTYKVQDWDAAAASGEIPGDHHSHDHLNEQKLIQVDEEIKQRWRHEFEQIKEAKAEAGATCNLGFGHQEVIEQLDVRIFLRVPHDVLKERRHQRHGYHTAEGSLWRDPPMYWEQIVWPAYVDAHRDMFLDGDLEHGEPGDKVKGALIVEPLTKSMGEVVETCCQVLRDIETR
ncbi:P-loop containing nucleoside triphosphate hydrolase protein [Armillaria novae-zelandiae]|uniref:P-loop containing nucleoside triphosphate hydrolase protein n=1 Tax=Armillaria novae-zelandiae TaxID=153914 RepID=A0AA39PKQ5_9AGAR|nr:P-loop containing nucleoside triphosphate hydrolase protein [Armillaria novae-zelandiae]